MALGSASNVLKDGRALIGCGSVKLTNSSQTANDFKLSLGVRLRVIRPVVERETALTAR